MNPIFQVNEIPLQVTAIILARDSCPVPDRYLFLIFELNVNLHRPLEQATASSYRHFVSLPGPIAILQTFIKRVGITTNFPPSYKSPL